MSNSMPPQQSEPMVDYNKMVYQQICTDLQNIEDFRLKLFGFLPIATAGSFFVTILTSSTITSSILNNEGQKTSVQNLVLPLGVLGAIITVALFLYEEENVLLASDLLEKGKNLEHKMGVVGQFEHKQSRLFNSQNGSTLMYSAVFAGWICLALWFTLPSHGLVLWLTLCILVLSLLVSRLYVSFRKPSDEAPEQQSAVSLSQR